MTIDIVAKVVSLVLSLIALISAIIGVMKWWRKRKMTRLNQQKAILDKLTELCSGQVDLEKQMTGIVKRLDYMDSERTDAREDDAYVRTRMYIGTVAVLDAIMKLASHEGLEINGEIAQYRKENIECLKNGTGIRR